MEVRSSESNGVDLGFAETIDDRWLLTNRYFPSKIGGKIAWLELENIPEIQNIQCDYCNDPCIFLCQIYAPSEANPNGFHRTIYLFVCPKGECCTSNQSGNIKVLRSQLPLKNKFFPDTPPDESVQMDEIQALCKACNVCSVKAPMVCGKCKTTNYCSQAHQKIDWKCHKKVCGTESQQTDNNFLFPEYEIVIEKEEKGGSDKTFESEKEAEKRRLREYEDMMSSDTMSNSNDITEKDLMDIAESKEDKVFGRFKKVTDEYPGQVIRYIRHGSPLLISNGTVKDVPKCGHCNGKRTFEFQIMPQMLNYLNNYDLDWGIIAVFTCENDCDTHGQYVGEFCFKQDILKGDEDVDLKGVEKISKMEINETREVKKPKEKPANSKVQSKKSQDISQKSSNKKKAFQECDEWE